jgi:HD superfamily phosphohydrolase
MNPYGGDDFDQKTFTIPISGGVRLWGPEVSVISTPEFQRLAGIKQLGAAYVVFRGAVHTRFEHSLGAIYQAQRLLDALRRNPATTRPVSDHEEQLVRMSALVHDITHVPFGHTLEDEFNLLTRHDHNAPRKKRLLFESRVGELLRRRFGRDWFADFATMVDAGSSGNAEDTPWPFAVDIISNTVCADMLDYVQRDLRACGMPAAIGDRFLDFFGISPSSSLAPEDRNRMVLNLDKRGMPRPDVESEVVKLLTYRYELVERVYFHHAKNAASVMLARAVQEQGLADEDVSSDEHFDRLNDATLLLCAADPAIAHSLGVPLAERSRARQHLATSLIERLQVRDLYKIAYLGVHDDLADKVGDLHDAYGAPLARVKLENLIARLAGLTPGDVLVHIPPPPMLLKLADVRILTHRGQVISLEEWDAMHSGRTSALVDAHRRLWRLAVYVPSDLDEKAKRLVRSASEDVIGAPTRYVKKRSSSAYLREVFDQNAKAEGWAIEDWESAQDASTTTETTPLDAVRALRIAINERRHGSTPGSDEPI